MDTFRNDSMILTTIRNRLVRRYLFDEGLWCKAECCSEAYIQERLRFLLTVLSLIQKEDVLDLIEKDEEKHDG